MDIPTDAVSAVAANTREPAGSFCERKLADA